MGPAKVWGSFSVLFLALAACSGADDASVGDGSGANGSGPGGSATTTSGTDPGGPGGSSSTAPGSPTDGIKNGTESDVDCGGTGAPKCVVDKACNTNADCATNACSYAKKCVEFPSCVVKNGGDTCGKGESCCTTIAVNGSAKFNVDKYALTAGRMRAFVEATQGNMQKWVNDTKPKGWNDAWTSHLPSSMDEALDKLGPHGKRGCNVVNQGGRTYWQPAGPAIDNDKGEVSDFSQDVLDQKALNCVTWHVAQAACAFDGKRLMKTNEARALYKNDNTTTYPWQFQDKSAYDPTKPDDRLAHRYNYVTPNAPAAMRLVNNSYPLDHAFYIAPPGSFPKGANSNGVEDMAGNTLPWLFESENLFIWTFSWENHKGDATTGTWNVSDGPEGYYAIGARCASD